MSGENYEETLEASAQIVCEGLNGMVASGQFETRCGLARLCIYVYECNSKFRGEREDSSVNRIRSSSRVRSILKLPLVAGTYLALESLIIQRLGTVPCPKVRMTAYGFATLHVIKHLLVVK